MILVENNAMRKLGIFIIVTSAIICILFGAIGIPALVNHIDGIEVENIRADLRTIEKAVTDRITSNITATANYVDIANSGIKSLYDIKMDTNYFNVSRFQELAGLPIEHSDFEIVRTLFFRQISSIDDKNQFIDFGKEYYNVTSFLLYDLTRDGPVFIEENNTDVAMLFVVSPYADTPGLPEIGSNNLYASVSPEDKEYINNSSNGDLIMLPIIRIKRVDGSTAILLIIGSKRDEWISSAACHPDIILIKMLEDITEDKNIKITVGDDEGTFYESDDVGILSNIRIATELNFGPRNWYVNLAYTRSYVDNRHSDTVLIIKIACSLLLILLFALVIIMAFVLETINKSVILKRENDSKKKVEIIHNSNNIILHEMRNIMNAMYMIFQLRGIQLLERDIVVLRESVYSLVGIISKVLDYEKLLSGNYIKKYENVVFLELMDKIMRKYQFTNIVMSFENLPKTIDIDPILFQELIQNVMNNSHKHNCSDTVIVRCQHFNHHLFIEIINRTDDFNIDNTEDLFVPFFIEGNRELWKASIEALTLDDDIVDVVNPHKGMDKFENIISYQKTIDKTIELDHKSTGLGLPITRLICKAFGGECNIEYIEDGGFVRFWVYIPVVNAGGDGVFVDVGETNV